jgi:hypothetical protein
MICKRCIENTIRGWTWNNDFPASRVSQATISRSWSVERVHFGPFLALTAERKPLLQRLGFSILTTPRRKTQNTNTTLPSVNKILRWVPQTSCSTGNGDRWAHCSSSQLLLTPVHALIYVCMHGRQPRRPRQSEGKLQQDGELFIL